MAVIRQDNRHPVTSMRLPVDLRTRITQAAPDRPMADVTREALELWLAHQDTEPGTP
jgi:hypothetical protein